MIVFVLAMALCGAIASLYLSWVFLALLGICAMPVFAVVMALAGTPPLAAFLKACVGFAVLEVSFVLTGWLLERRRFRGRARLQDPRGDRRWSLFGGWLPLIAVFEPPCHADGSPWNGIDEPGYRVRTLVLGWGGRAISVLIGAPHAMPRQSDANRGVFDDTIAAMDARIGRERERLSNQREDRDKRP